MTREQFKSRLSELIQRERGEGYTLDLRASRSPYRVNEDNDIFGLCDAEMDRAYDFVKDAEEWYVDVYANTPDEFGGHADFIRSTLWCYDGDGVRTARDKFESRMAELGLWHEWCEQGKCGRIATETNDGIVILCNEGDDDDFYTEALYPPLSEMENDLDFRLKALSEFCDHDDAQFVYRLCKWVVDKRNKCPLFPVDVYFLWDTARVTTFEDDKEEEEEEKPAYKSEETTEEWCSHCDECVELQGEFKVQRCPNCGKWIVPCSACPLESCQFPCPLETMASILNKEEISNNH